VSFDDPNAVIAYLEKNYFLVGLTEYLDEFVVLLGLHMGWDINTLYVPVCKHFEDRVTRSDFQEAFPEVTLHLFSSSIRFRTCPAGWDGLGRDFFVCCNLLYFFRVSQSVFSFLEIRTQIKVTASRIYFG
jgi:hypothetical protein